MLFGNLLTLITAKTGIVRTIITVNFDIHILITVEIVSEILVSVVIVTFRIITQCAERETQGKQVSCHNLSRVPKGHLRPFG